MYEIYIITNEIKGIGHRVRKFSILLVNWLMLK